LNQGLSTKLDTRRNIGLFLFSSPFEGKLKERKKEEGRDE
jgi:hypothetical protein